MQRHIYIAGRGNRNYFFQKINKMLPQFCFIDSIVARYCPFEIIEHKALFAARQSGNNIFLQQLLLLTIHAAPFPFCKL